MSPHNETVQFSVPVKITDHRCMIDVERISVISSKVEDPLFAAAFSLQGNDLSFRGSEDQFKDTIVVDIRKGRATEACCIVRNVIIPFF
jgi:hypothetical protein